MIERHMNIEIVAGVEIFATIFTLVEEAVGEVDVLNVLDEVALLQAHLAAQAAAVGPPRLIVHRVDCSSDGSRTRPGKKQRAGNFFVRVASSLPVIIHRV
jgi:hypothetical protein